MKKSKKIARRQGSVASTTSAVRTITHAELRSDPEPDIITVEGETNDLQRTDSDDLSNEIREF